MEIELNDANIKLLLNEPDDESYFTPQLPNQANCSWVPSRHAVTCDYRNRKHSKWFLKSITIDMKQSRERIQKDVTKAALKLEKFYEENHDRPLSPSSPEDE